MAIKPRISFGKKPEPNGEIKSKLGVLKEGIVAKHKEEEQIKEQITGLGIEEAAPIDTVSGAIDRINALFKEEDVPHETIKIGLNEVMRLLKQYEDVVLELKPEQISDIVTGYMALADEETRTIFDKAAKKKKPAKKAPTKIANILKAAKESNPGDDEDWLNEL